jgi:hypothetical protein
MAEIHAMHKKPLMGQISAKLDEMAKVGGGN